MSLTMEIRRALEVGEYSDPVQVRRLLRGGEFAVAEFRESLWSAVMAAFPCPKESGIPSNLTAAKQKLWGQMCEEEPDLPVRERIFRKCLSSNLCMQCECKKLLIDFFVEIGSGSADTVRHRLASWLSGRVKKLERLTCIQLCFAMNMRVYPAGSSLTDREKLMDANRFLTLTCGQPPLYTMIPEEAVYYYCLANPQGRSNSENWMCACSLAEKAARYSAGEAEEEMHTMYAVSVIENIRTENELLEFVAGCSMGEHELYATAKENCRLLFEQFEIAGDVSDAVDGGRNSGSAGKKRAVLKKDARKILDALCDYNETGRIAPEIIEGLEKYQFGDILYSSDLLEAFLEDEVMPDRTLLLLTVLAQNCGMKYDPESNTLEESDDLTDLPSFSEYFISLSNLLRNMCMAPLYPRRRMDFIVLYAYHLLQKDILGERETGALSEYIIRELRLTMEENCND